MAAESAGTVAAVSPSKADSRSMVRERLVSRPAANVAAMEDFTNWRRDELRIAHLDRFSFLDVLAPMGLPRWGAAGRAPRKDQVKRFRSSLGSRSEERRVGKRGGLEVWG